MTHVFCKQCGNYIPVSFAIGLSNTDGYLCCSCSIKNATEKNATDKGITK